MPLVLMDAHVVEVVSVLLGFIDSVEAIGKPFAHMAEAQRIIEGHHRRDHARSPFVLIEACADALGGDCTYDEPCAYCVASGVRRVR